MAALAAWGRVVLLGPDGVEIAGWVLTGRGAPDLSVVERLARIQLAARRAGGRIQVHGMSDELADLLDVVGLRREVGGEPEGGEEVGVEEGVEFGDPVA